VLRVFISTYSVKDSFIKSNPFDFYSSYRDYNRAMKTAMRLIEYEKEL